VSPRVRGKTRSLYNGCMPPRMDPPNTRPHKGKIVPAEDTFEEASYLKLLGEKQKPVSVKLTDGEVVYGWVEYYDRNMIRLTREGAPNLFIYKHEIVYIQEEGQRRG
jgi:host factor-I protein